VAHSVTLRDVSDHFTLRFPTGTTARLRHQAERSGLAARTLAQRYVEEGLRHDRHPLVHFLDGPSGRRAALAGSGLDVWEVIATVRDNENDLEEASSYLGVPLGLVQAAVAYYGEYPDEIDAEIELNEAEWESGYASWEAGQRALES
jgi:uncharacterized protein (DUF433 family)